LHGHALERKSPHKDIIVICIWDDRELHSTALERTKFQVEHAPKQAPEPTDYDRSLGSFGACFGACFVRNYCRH
jgi:hypothetical protein